MFQVNDKETNQCFHHHEDSKLVYASKQWTSFSFLVTLALKWFKAYGKNGAYQKVVVLLNQCSKNVG